MHPDHNLFSAPVAGLERLPLPDAEIHFQPDFYGASERHAMFQELSASTAWRQEQITLFGKRHWQPRLVAAHGDAGTQYTYSGLTLPMHPWSALLQQIRRDIEAASGRTFNSVLLNLYRNEQDSMGWHSDDESELGPAPVIASLSLGATRIFKLRHKTRRELKTAALPLTDGTLLLMAGATQQHWKHAVDKERGPAGARINLTFRLIVR
ncbi:alkylated DNA repair dioxygenase AlkB [Actimicrobium sp. GrIS 1.19]|uniref:alpha-ketoglutarate-dependent dioxygenase AlkB family protein n=1 Tax=Actimicrobium sp. GrIS 1.19 TaxID=3071708 RepID=UPI002E051B47|nr:alkylated DNA repair dioxygenase AlkB [Actimicrobium sp. GrIS 1.19]